MTFIGASQVVTKATRYYERHVLDEVSGRRDWWPQRIVLGWPGRAEATAAFGSGELQEWMRGVSILEALGVTVEWGERRIARVMARVPHAVEVASADVAARMIGRRRDYEELRRRASLVRERHAQVATDTLRHVLAVTSRWPAEDFDDLVRVSAYLAGKDVSGMTSREVPLPELGAKWLDSGGRRGLVESLIGRELGLEGRTWAIQCHYLDPSYLDAGGRRYDTYRSDDPTDPPYTPSVVVIVENYDTWERFPRLRGGVCVYGAGKAGVKSIPEVPWVRDAESVVYWGDIDADALEILDAYRSRGLAATSVLMDMEAWRRYERLGTDRATGVRALSDHPRQSVGSLTERERELYLTLTSASCPGKRRVEQERIPYDDAMDAIKAAAGQA